MRPALACLAILAAAPARADVVDPFPPDPLTLERWLELFPDREDLRVCVGRRTGEWKIALDASAGAPNRARAQVRRDPALGRCLAERLRKGLAGAALERRKPDREVHEEHVFRVLDGKAIERAYLDRRRYRWSAAEERDGLAKCIAGAAAASPFPLRVPIRISLEGAPFVDWPPPPPPWWVAEELLRNCLSYYLGGVPHIAELPFEHRFVVEVRRDGTVTIPMDR